MRLMARWAPGIGLATVLACAALAAPAAAQCGGDPIPPGNSEVDQYQESIPGNCGDTKANSDGKGGGSVSQPTAEDLGALGEDGAAVSDLVATTGPAVKGGNGTNGKNGNDGPGAGSEASTADTGGSAVAAAVRALTGDSDGGLGLGLPFILVVVSAAVLGLVALRRSSRT